MIRENVDKFQNCFFFLFILHYIKTLKRKANKNRAQFLMLKNKITNIIYYIKVHNLNVSAQLRAIFSNFKTLLRRIFSRTICDSDHQLLIQNLYVRDTHARFIFAWKTVIQRISYTEINMQMYGLRLY